MIPAECQFDVVAVQDEERNESATAHRALTELQQQHRELQSESATAQQRSRSVADNQMAMQVGDMTHSGYEIAASHKDFGSDQVHLL